jgi:hypothetical protein
MISEKGTGSILEEGRQFDPPEAWRDRTHIMNQTQYQNMYRRSLEDPEGFWAECAQELDWMKKWDKVYEGDFGKARVKWFAGGKLPGIASIAISAQALMTEPLSSGQEKTGAAGVTRTDNFIRRFAALQMS